MQDFRNLEVWQRGRALAADLYRQTAAFPREELYGLTSQIRRCSVSIPANIAEGCGRQSDADFKRFLHVAMGSAAELESHLILAEDVCLLNHEDAQALTDRVSTLRRKLNAFIQRLNTPRHRHASTPKNQ